ncbi:MAG: right-handed parallel beta-helix repeat-containing protein [Acidobacteriota bacterium]|nr:MAG: right-handed parallel beta-helix repeat-containing protein [Acidobacteriota bacterium]
MTKKTKGVRVFFAVLVSCIVAAGMLFNSYRVSGTSAHSGSISDDPKDVPSISARERGNPYMNFDDGRTITLPEGAAAGSPARSMAKGDVNSDGTPDLIVADSGGAIHVYRGNPDSIFPNSAAAQQRRESNTFTEDPFIYSHMAAVIPTAPDVLESGDFNADGHIDVIAARFGESSIFFAAGDGKGNFAPAMRIDVGGAVTALFAGEIGRPDGQTDLAVAVAAPDGPRLLVFEHPEGAFKNPAEMYVLPAQATTMTAGNLDSDSYRDLAIGSGNILTIIRGRGHTYPWDKLKEVQLERPRPLVDSKQMPFEIASMVVGRFGHDNSEVLAFVTTSGAIETLSRPTKRAEVKKLARPAKALEQFIPVGARAMRLATMEYAVDQENMIRRSDIKRGAALVSNINDHSASEEFTPNKRENDAAASFATQRARDGFIMSISPSAEEPLSRWQTREVFRDARFAQAAVYGGSAMRAVRVHISDSGRDELAVLDRVGSQIHLFRRGASYANGTRSTDEVVTFDSNAVPVDLLPMRLNRDALSDLVILHEGSAVPSVAMTAPMATYVVTTNDDVSGCGEGICSLRGAIFAASNNPGPDLIAFSIGGGPPTIDLNTQLPSLTSGTTLDATTQPGYSGSPLITIPGHNLGNRSDGLQISGSNCVIRGFVVNRFKGEYDASMGGIVGGNGIAVLTTLGSSTSLNNFVEGNYSGTNIAGTSDLGNDTTGVNIFAADETTVGGTIDEARNVLSGSGSDNDPTITPRKFGAGAAIFGGQYNVFKGNYIGTNALGTAKINNTQGIRMAGGNTLVGGNEAGAGNVISGNGDRFTVYNPDGCIGPGIEEETVYDPNTLEFLSLFNDYRGNKIGTNAAGTAAVGNCSTGLRTKPSHMSSIGSITSSGRNVISGNLENALYCSPMPRGFGIAQGPEPPAGYCSIAGNNIGTDITGSFAIPNRDYNNYDFFILFFGAVAVFNSDTLSNVGGPGGTSPGQCQGHCNLISGNENEAVFRGSALGEVGIFNNFLGTTRSGNSAIGNDTGFSSFENGITYVGGVGIDNAHGGGGLIPLGNLISGNLYNGITMDSTPPRSFLPKYIQNNRIGTDASGTNAIPNSTESGFGMLIVNEVALIGGSDPMHRNIISGNAYDGILMSGSIGNPIIANNYIGVGSTGQPLGNGQDGIRVNASGVTVGYDADTGNVIANNGRVGVFVPARTNQPSLSNRYNPIRFNSIYNNGALGIDLSVGTGFVVPPDGVTPNDCFDTDIFANDRQNYPDLSAPVFNGNGTVSVEGVLRSEQERTYVIDFYASSTADPSNYGEGQTYIGSTTVTTDFFFGAATFLFTSTVPVAPGSKITATATDPDGNTSEFSCVAGECSATDCLVPIVVNVTNDLPDNSPANGICDVDLSAPGLQCSLRGAIQTAQAMTGPKVIHFEIPGGGPHTITLGSELPTITKPIQFAGNTQPGFTGTPLIHVTGNGVRNNCLNLGAGSDASEVKGLSLTGCQVGLNIQSSNTKVESSYFGITPAGVADGALGEQTKGIRVLGTNNRIGSTEGKGNVLGNNGIAISFESGSGNAVLGNWIGVPESSGPATPNNIGVKIQNSTGNKIGDAGGGNTIAGNVGDGIRLEQADSTKILANIIGAYISEGGDFVPLGNLENGIHVTGSSNVEVGDITPEMANRIVSNEKHAILLDNLTQVVKVKGNLIGTAIRNIRNFGDSGHTAGQGQTFGNGLGGIRIANGSNNNVIGGPESDSGNIIVDNGGNGIEVVGSIGNKIGDAGAGNTIAGNSGDGIKLVEAATTTIEANLLGLYKQKQEYHKLANTENGINVINSSNIEIGNIDEIRANIIAGNEKLGIFIDQQAQFIRMRGNLIGTAIRNIRNFGDSGHTAGQGQTFGNGLGGIRIANGSNNNVIGGPGSDSGNIIVDNGGNGIEVVGSIGNKIGDAGAGNTIAGNSGDGIKLVEAATTTVEANLVGVYKQNQEYQKLANTANGISVLNSINIELGNIELQRANIIAGNQQLGILIDQQAQFIRMRGNLIGTVSRNISNFGDSGHTAGQGQTFGNGLGGIRIANGSNNNVIGGPESDSGNIIAFNSGDGIEINASPGNTIGGIGVGNEITANAGNGISIRGANSINNTLIGNLIGTTASAPLLERKRLRGSTLGNGGNGILIVDAPNTQVGSTTPGTGNRIFDNDLSGIKITASTGQFPAGAQVFAIGNEISFNAQDGISNLSQHEALHVVQNNRIEANNGKGIDLDESNNNSVTQNFVAMNGEEGVVLAGNATRLNNVRGNIIAENVSHGVNIDNGANTNNIGGPNSGQGNTIRNNGGAGINLSPTAGSGNNLDPNSIFGNVGLGIDLGGDGFTINDPLDADEGPNRLQNYPTIMSSQISNNELVVSYFMDSLPGNSNYGTEGIYIEFFKADINGEGEIFLGSTYYTEADYNGLAPTVKSVNLGDIDVLGYTPTDRVTSTATDADGNTSEFSPTLGPTSAGVSVSGRVLTAAGVAIRGTTVTITDDNGVVRTAVTSSLGYYAFEGVQAGRTYVVTAVSRRYRFTPRIVNVADPISDLDLVALE